MKKKMTITLTEDELTTVEAKATARLMHKTDESSELVSSILIIGAMITAEMADILFDKYDKGGS